MTTFILRFLAETDEVVKQSNDSFRFTGEEEAQIRLYGSYERGRLKEILYGERCILPLVKFCLPTETVTALPSGGVENSCLVYTIVVETETLHPSAHRVTAAALLVAAMEKVVVDWTEIMIQKDGSRHIIHTCSSLRRPS